MNPNCLQKHNNVKKVCSSILKKKKNDSPCVFPRVTEINFFLLGWSEINLFLLNTLFLDFFFFRQALHLPKTLLKITVDV